MFPDLLSRILAFIVGAFQGFLEVARSLSSSLAQIDVDLPAMVV